jgi:hypothetical protein
MKTDTRLEPAMRLEATLDPGKPIDAGMTIVNVPKGRLVGPDFTGTIVPPSAEWLRTPADAPLRLDVRVTAQMDDESFIFMAYTGRIVVNAKVQEAMATRQPLSGPDFYMVTSPTVRTTSKRYAWLAKTVFVSRCTNLLFPTEDEPGFIEYDVYKVEAEQALQADRYDAA